MSTCVSADKSLSKYKSIEKIAKENYLAFTIYLGLGYKRREKQLKGK